MSSSAQEMTCDSAVVQTSDSIIVQKMRQAGVKFYKHNQVKLLKSGSAKFHDMLKAISLAESSVHLDYFNFRNDSIAKRLFRHLAERSANGVEVRAIYDSFGNMSNSRPLKKKHLKTIEGWGIEIREFDKIKFPWVNHVWRHDHRKIVVIDGKVAYSGGMNVADYYVDGLPKIGPWRDMHFRVQGPVINEYQKTFFGNWNTLTRQNIHGAKYYCGIDSVEQSFLPEEFNDSYYGGTTLNLRTALEMVDAPDGDYTFQICAYEKNGYKVSDYSNTVTYHYVDQPRSTVRLTTDFDDRGILLINGIKRALPPQGGVPGVWRGRQTGDLPHRGRGPDLHRQLYRSEPKVHAVRPDRAHL